MGERKQPPALTAEKAQAIAAALNSGNAVFCYTKCWPCQFGQHFDPPEPHTWGDDEDRAHAEATGQPEPGNCGCWCAKSLAAREKDAYDAGRVEGRQQLRKQIEGLRDDA